MSQTKTQCGFIAIVGRPNVGKSTLLNHLLGQKISITSRKPQTTRHRIHGIHTEGDRQFIYVDTPGLHRHESKAMNRAMNATVIDVLREVDVVLFMTERTVFNEEDELVLQQLKKINRPVLWLINKSDLLPQRDRLLPHISAISERHGFAEVIPLSVLKGYNLEAVEECVARYLPEGPFLFPEDQVTDRSSRFLAAELVREKITRQVGDELPYEAMVEIEQFVQEPELIHIHALILVEKKGQKQIIIGRGGERLKQIGQAARLDMERAFGCKVMLELWVKVKSGWSDDERALQSLN
ncbi:MAG: GTPase Era [Pseudomonadota bacterium]